MTTATDPEEPTEPVATPEPAAAPTPPPPVVAERPSRSAFSSPIVRIGAGVIAAVLIFGGGFATGHWAFERHDHDRRPDFSARAQRFMQGMQGQRGNQSQNGPMMGQTPNLQQVLPLIEGLLNNRGGMTRSPGSAGSDDVQRWIQQLEQQVKQLQEQLKVTPTPTTR